MTLLSLSVREMELVDIDLRIRYFHDASDEHLRILGVDRTLLPSWEQWHRFYETDYARPIRERINYSLVWELDGQAVGFSSTDQITFGSYAFMHLHILSPAQRRSGLGAQFVKLSAATYFRVLELKQLFCQPNAFNVAPNRTLQRAGFTYLLTHHTTPSAINFPQAVTRWVLHRPPEQTPRSSPRRKTPATVSRTPKPGTSLADHSSQLDPGAHREADAHRPRPQHLPGGPARV